MATKVRGRDEINEHLAELGAELGLQEGLSLYLAEVDELTEQDRNARSMSMDMFSQLVENVKSTGGLESVPLCVRTERGIEIISGHHRVRAARAAGVTRLVVLLYASLSRARIASKQLAHNSIAGQDDPEMLKRIFESIDDIAARFEAFLDPKLFDDIPEPVTFRPPDVDIERLAKGVTFLFLSSQLADFKEAVDRLGIDESVDTVYLAQREVYDGWTEALQRVREDLQVRSIPTAIAEMARLAVEALDARNPVEPA
jgi:hypothetical protein